MRRWLPALLATASLLAVSASLVCADVRVRAAVEPDTLTQCSIGHVFTAIANTGAARIEARVCIRIMRADSVRIGPICGRVSLAPGERRTREFPILIPARFPVGRYAIVIGAVASDSTSDRAFAPFTVLAGTCTPPPPSTVSPADDLMNSLMQGLQVSPDQVTDTKQRSWGMLKLRYR